MLLLPIESILKFLREMISRCLIIFRHLMHLEVALPILSKLRLDHLVTPGILPIVVRAS
jgi:hypothetical protein